MRHFAAVLALSAWAVSATAQAQNLNHRLHGTYALSYTRTCAQTPTGFAEANLQALGPVNLSVTVIDSINTYDGHGNFTAKARTLTLNTVATAAGSFPLSESEFECQGTYQVGPDGSFTETASCNGPILSGSLTGQTFTSTNAGLSGRVKGKQLLVAEAKPRAQTITFSQAGAFERLCGRSGSGLKIDNDD